MLALEAGRGQLRAQLEVVIAEDQHALARPGTELLPEARIAPGIGVGDRRPEPSRRTLRIQAAPPLARALRAHPSSPSTAGFPKTSS